MDDNSEYNTALVLDHQSNVLALIHCLTFCFIQYLISTLSPRCGSSLSRTCLKVGNGVVSEISICESVRLGP